MSKKLELPEELIDLPEPWRVTDDLKRTEVVRELPLTPQAFDVALNTLGRTLQALTRLPDPESLTLPEEIGDSYSFVFYQFANQMASLDSVADDYFIEYLKGLLGKQPDEALVQDLANAWVHSTSAGISRSILRWVSEHWRQFPRERRSQLVDIAAPAWAKLSEELAITLLTSVAIVAGTESFALLERVQEQGGTPSLREIARRYKELITTRGDSVS